MSCTKDTERCLGVHPCCQDHIMEMLIAIHEILLREDIPHWLNFGTLLGAVRQGDLIPWDEDGDIGIWECDAEKVVERHLFDEKKYPTRINKLENGRACSVPLFYSEVNSLHVCLNTFGVSRGFAFGIEWSGMCYRVEDLVDLGTVKLRGYEFPCPSNPEFGLLSFYGPDWRVPKVKHWIKQYSLQPGCDPELVDLINKNEEYEYEDGRKYGPL